MKALVNKLDRIFSKFIRLRDSNAEGYGKCVTCGKIVHWKQADAGHFLGRQYKSTRWFEPNVHFQCRYCNRFNEGEKYKFGKFIEKKYGEQMINILTVKKNNVCKYHKFELEALISEYKLKVEELEALKRAS